MLFDLLHISFILWQVLCSLAGMLGGRGVSKGKGIDCHICLSPFLDETFSTEHDMMLLNTSGGCVCVLTCSVSNACDLEQDNGNCSLQHGQSVVFDGQCLH